MLEMTKLGYGMLGFGTCEITSDMKPTTIKDRILEALEAGPQTARELAGKLGVSLGTVPACMSQLRDAGKVEQCATARYGRSRAQAIVWRLVKPFCWHKRINEGGFCLDCGVRAAISFDRPTKIWEKPHAVVEMVEAKD